MSDPVTLPPEIVALHDALGRILQRIKEGTEPAGPDNDHEPFDIVESGVLPNQLTRLQTGVGHLTSAINELGEAMEAGECDSATVYSNMGRVEAHLEVLQAECVEVGAWRVSGEDLVARDLMTAIYRHTLDEIRLWLEEAVTALADLISALEKQSVGPTEQAETSQSATGPGPPDMKIRSVLELTPAPELSTLTVWTERQAKQQLREQRGCLAGIWIFVVGALFGGWLGGWGDDDCDFDNQS